MVTVLIVLFGILLPAIALVVELNTGMCAEVFFDPISTLGHVALVALVPAANLLALIVAWGGWTRWRTPLLWLNGVALGVALIYTLVFLPIAPLAVIGIIVGGMGLLPLAPLCSLLCAIALRRRLVRMTMAAATDTPAEPTPERCPAFVSLLVGGALGVLLLLAIESRIALTLLGAEMAADNSPSQQVRGVRLLRNLGDRDELLRMCYRDGSRRGGIFSRGHSFSMCGYLFDGVPRAEAQQVFFRVTGEPYNAQPPPRGARRMLFDEFDFDPDLGGEAVAGRRKGLSLSSSRIDAKLYPDPAVAYLEWTMVFKNDHRQQREARAQVLLPPGGVVSRATLWVFGEPREAAFAGTAQVREAYQKVAVQQRRDPLLVTWAGNDRVLMQCFPIPANGEMKIRLGITVPLMLVKSDVAALRLPCFAERNFGVASRDIHSLWIESDRPCLRAPEQLCREKLDVEKHVLRGMLADDLLASAGCTVAVSRSAEATESWTPDKLDPKKYVLQKIVSFQPPAKTRIVVVVDGSREMAEHFEAIGKALGAAKDGTEIRVLLAGDEVANLSDAVGISGGPKGLAGRLREIAGVGGCDNVPALLRAFDEAGDEKTVVWIHGQQPIVLQPSTPLVQWLERGAKLTIHDLAVGSGANRLAEQLGPLGCLQAVPRTGKVRDDLRDLLARLTGQTNEYRFERTLTEGTPPEGPKSTSHLARLWAAGKAAALARTGKPAKRAEAVKLAAAYQLVTPVSGAVVLENKQQYEESDLHPADPETVPDLPEPAVWIMLLTALPWMLWRLWKRRRRSLSLQ
ncbi:MAG: hypothetical protein K8R46_02355 [Pirellulales bacterium]|nr:hypothetical protein [Pirellulales bacterium]